MGGREGGLHRRSKNDEEHPDLAACTDRVSQK